MKGISWIFLFGGLLVGLSSCVSNSKVETSLGFTLMIIDAPCREVIDSIPINLNKRDIPAVWINEDEGLLSAGPITEKSKPGNPYSMIRHTYQLSITCGDELSTRITGKATLEGLHAETKWSSITDTQVIEKIALKFLRSLDYSILVRSPRAAPHTLSRIRLL